VSLVTRHEAGPEIVTATLSALRNPDGGYPPVTGGDSEPEPTALAALALDDDEARTWLLDRQRPDGAWFVGPDALGSDAATPFGALALEGTSASESAVDYLIAHPAAYVDPDNPEDRGWGWTYGTYTWVDPTARTLVALNRLRPNARPIPRGQLALELRECVGGGWNYGSPEVLGTNVEPYLATTAMAVMALHSLADPMLERGTNVIKRLWPEEDGLLSGALAVAALRLTDNATEAMEGVLVKRMSFGHLAPDAVALAWTAIALGPGLDRLRLQP